MTKRSVFILPANRRGLVPAGLGVEHELGAYAIDRELENLGYAVRVFDVHDRPLNPFA